MGNHDKLLLAMYREYKMGNRDMRKAIDPVRLKMDPEQFKRQVQELQNQGLIHGALVIRDRNKPYPDQVILNRVAMTNYGLYYINKILQEA